MSTYGTRYSPSELEIVRSMYPTAPWVEILRALPGRTRKGITTAASQIGVERPRQAYDVQPKSEGRQRSIARAEAKRSAKRKAIARQHVGKDGKMAAARRKAGLSGAEVAAQLARMREAREQPCTPGTYRASNGVTLAVPGKADIYSERRSA